jgi:hypothetical protein
MPSGPSTLVPLYALATHFALQHGEDGDDAPAVERVRPWTGPRALFAAMILDAMDLSHRRRMTLSRSESGERSRPATRHLGAHIQNRRPRVRKASSVR